jgi:hypothetical protein
VSKESPVCEPRARLGQVLPIDFRMTLSSVTDLLSARTLPRLNLLRANMNGFPARPTVA